MISQSSVNDLLHNCFSLLLFLVLVYIWILVEYTSNSWAHFLWLIIPSSLISMNLIEMVTQLSDITFSHIHRELNTKVDGISKEALLVHENTTMIVKDKALDLGHTFQRCLMD